MKLVFTGGGSGGHFYPIIAVIEKLRKSIKEHKLLDPKIYYMATDAYDPHTLFEQGIEFREVPAGKRRIYFSISNLFDIFKTIRGVMSALFQLFSIYPDVVFGKGGFSSFPTLFAAKILRIPVIIHESDSVPGRVNQWAGKFAQKIAVSYPEAAKYFEEGKVAFTGNPVREEIKDSLKTGAYEFLKMESSLPTLLFMGGSQGSEKINDALLGTLGTLVEKYQIIHQTGKYNYKDVQNAADVILTKSPFKNRYRAFDYLNDLSMRMSAGVADLVISRAGSTIFEIAGWGIPSIIIPIAESNGNHQVENAFNYARTGACIVLEEHNLAPHILASEIEKVMSDKNKLDTMAKKAKEFSKPDAAQKIANEILALALQHEK
jgi:UDP-N-acetylglucosamine--N-acetylmuramyl-(pentapeptide) pyrophosphoryl-undecaprenol N-acetylglucosamine transferase